MSDTTYVLQLQGAKLDSIDKTDTAISLHFSEVRLVQEMEGAFEDSLWTQAVNLVIEQPDVDDALPSCPCILSGGDMVDNIYTYRNHAPLPIDWRGDVRCRLQVDDNDAVISIAGSAIKVEQIDTPRYLRHISKEA